MCKYVLQRQALLASGGHISVGVPLLPCVRIRAGLENLPNLCAIATTQSQHSMDWIGKLMLLVAVVITI